MAHPAVGALQRVLLEGKRSGVSEIAGLGTFSWPEMVALADTLLGAFWTSTTLEERTDVWCRYESNASMYRGWRCRFTTAGMTASDSSPGLWKVGQTPWGASVGRDMLERGLTRPRNRLSHHVTPRWKGHPWGPSPHDFAPETVARLRKLIEA